MATPANPTAASAKKSRRVFVISPPVKHFTPHHTIHGRKGTGAARFDCHHYAAMFPPDDLFAGRRFRQMFSAIALMKSGGTEFPIRITSCEIALPV
jgi:hypothetical protein